VVGVLALLAAGLGTGILAFYEQLPGLLSACGIAVGLFAMALLLSRRYRTANSTICVFTDRLEVPRPWRGRDSFPFADLSIHRLHLTQRATFFLIPAGEMDRGEVVIFCAGEAKRTLSDRVFVAPGSLPRLLEDVSAAQKGGTPRGPSGWATLERQKTEATAAAAEHDPFEAQLDAELAGNNK